MSTRILITGSSGFIGTHLVKMFASEGHIVYGLDMQKPTAQLHGFHFLPSDIRNATEVGQIFSNCQPDLVVHLAARTDLDGANKSHYSANIEGVRNVVKAVANTPSVKRCVYTSSQLVCRVGYVPENEQDYCPNTPYGESKVLTEQIVRENDGGGCEWCLVRPTSVWGPGMSAHYQRFLRMIQGGRYFHVGTRPLYKSYSYVGNIVEQYRQLLIAPITQVCRRAFYLADYEPLSLRDWADAFQREFEAKPIPKYPESLVILFARIGDLINACGFRKFPFNSFRLNNILTEYRFDLTETQIVCAKLPYSMIEGVKETAAWFRQIK